MKRKIFAVMMISILASCGVMLTACNKDREYSVPRESKFVDVNGVNIHYETCGSGQPFILLHGNGGDVSVFDGLVDKLSAGYKVYAIDTRGHGKSGAVSEYHYSDMVEDVYAFINTLGLDKPLLYGYSDGGIVGLMFASRYPDALDKLMVSGANTVPSALKGYFTLGAKIGRAFTKGAKKSLYNLMIEEPNITDADLEKISVPTLVLAGTRDIVKEENTRHIAEKISGSTLNIVKGSHGSYINDSANIYSLLTSWLDGND